MDSGLIGKIEKGKRYAEDRSRFLFNEFNVTFRGTNNDHVVKFNNGKFDCDCEFFITHQHCAHSHALEILLENMLPEIVTE